MLITKGDVKGVVESEKHVRIFFLWRAKVCWLGQSLAYVGIFGGCLDSKAAVACRCATNLATHFPAFLCLHMEECCFFIFVNLNGLRANRYE